MLALDISTETTDAFMPLHPMPVQEQRSKKLDMFQPFRLESYESKDCFTETRIEASLFIFLR
uniref:Uncharacterized protein n=1 Tax=Rhizophora mucronata TaxID=61149 RepID=A0A2P2QI33_RHIMU